jgi:precorrin-3B C17-methyltransferase
MSPVAVVGLGPGAADLCTPEVRRLLSDATDWVGYDTYLDLAVGIVAPGPEQTLHRSDNREEAARARAALDLAADGRDVVVVSSGDPGIFAMAAAVMEQLYEGGWPDVEVTVHPGVSAAQATAARAGAPLGHDFCVVSLSDNLKPWSIIERRLDAAASADFVLALYNPRSRARPDQFLRALEVIAAHRGDETPVVLGRDVGRPDESVRILTLRQLRQADEAEQVDMRTTVIVGSSTTRLLRDGAYTPRSYPA